MIYSETQIEKKQLNNFINGLQYYLMTSRFNNETIEENRKYREGHKNIGCVYCSPEPTSIRIPIDTVMFILEMNNDENKIIGIGMVRNHPILQKYSIYKNGNYNRYTFIGKNRIDRKDVNEEEEKIMKVFDILCFTGNKHMKRGQGLKAFPYEMLYRMSKRLDLVKYIVDMFKRRMNNNNNSNKIK